MIKTSVLSLAILDLSVDHTMDILFPFMEYHYYRVNTEHTCLLLLDRGRLNNGTEKSLKVHNVPWSAGWPHHGRTFSIYLCPLSFWLTLPHGVLSMSWCCPSRLCVVFLACMHLTLFLALSLSPGNSLVSNNSILHICSNALYRQTTCLENLEMSGNLLKVREVSWKKSYQEKWQKTIYC